MSRRRVVNPRTVFAAVGPRVRVACVVVGRLAWAGVRRTPRLTRTVFRLLGRIVAGLARWWWTFTWVCSAWMLRRAALVLLALGIAWLWFWGATGAGYPGPVKTESLFILVAGLAPGVIRGVWAATFPTSYQRHIAGPAAWRRWSVMVRKDWIRVADHCGLSIHNREGEVHVPGLVDVHRTGGALVLRIAALPGQTTDTLAAAAPRIATAWRATGFEVRPVAPGVVDVVMFVADVLAQPAVAVLPGQVWADAVPVGRHRDGSAFWLPVRGRHTLVVGVSGAGKGSVMWSVLGNLAPAVAEDRVRLWGVDLKMGVELAMAEPLFHTTAYTAEDAVQVLRHLLAVIDARGAAMRGVSRLHEPRPGDPLHVLVVDELADLMAYSEFETRRDAERLLAKILTKGRAVGVVVVACVQNPRQEAVGLRNLYTQKVALRLDSPSATEMVLDGLAPMAPAHEIAPTTPGVAYVVNDDGTASKVRFDYWPDELLHATAARYPAPVVAQTPMPTPAPTLDRAADGGEAWAAARARLADPAQSGTEARPRRPRAPRKPRAPRAPRPAPAQVSVPAEDGAA